MLVPSWFVTFKWALSAAGQSSTLPPVHSFAWFPRWPFLTSSLSLCWVSCFSEENQSRAESSADAPTTGPPGSTDPCPPLPAVDPQSPPTPGLSHRLPPLPLTSRFLSLLSCVFCILLDHSQQLTIFLLFSHLKTNTKTPPPLWTPLPLPAFTYFSAPFCSKTSQLEFSVLKVSSSPLLP